MKSDTEMVTRDTTGAVDFEQVVFERVGDEVDITISGMTAGSDPELMVFESPTRTSVSAVGSRRSGDQRRFTASVRVSISDVSRIVVRGEQGTETVSAHDLLDGLALVCSADPTDPALPASFLHRRGDRYVLMNRSYGAQAAHVA